MWATTCASAPLIRMTEPPRSRYCQDAGGLIRNVNDAPTVSDRSVTAHHINDYTFTADDFMFTDQDGDSLVSVTIATLPAAGTLSDADGAIDAGDTITAATINDGDLTYSPADNAMGGNTTTFTFSVTDDGAGPGGTTTANRTAAPSK